MKFLFAVRLIFGLCMTILLIFIIFPIKKTSIRYLEKIIDVEIPSVLANNRVRHVFFDLGANIGDSARLFVSSNDTKSHLLEGYGAKDDKEWDIYSIEANPLHDFNLDMTKKHIESLGHTHHLYKQTAAWIVNENLTFFLDTVNTVKNFWGSSLHKEHNDAKRSNFKNVTVTGVDISMLLKEFNKDDEIVMKVDIEGSEYALLDHLIRESTIHLVDLISIEFHNILLDEHFNYNEKIIFYKSYFKLFDIKYIPWYMGHVPFHN
jgi:FkbM family methyltransferase